jgi:hypothetical protein
MRSITYILIAVLAVSILWTTSVFAYPATCTLPKAEVNRAVSNIVQGGAQAPTQAFVLLEAHPLCFSWPYYYLYAKALWGAGEKDRAVFWFYAGQLQGRVAAMSDPEPSRSSALLASLNDMMGPTINAYAGRDLDAGIATIDAVLAWDAAHRLEPDPALLYEDPSVRIDRKAWDAHYAEVLEGLKDMRNELDSMDREAWKAERRANGLE